MNLRKIVVEYMQPIAYLLIFGLLMAEAEVVPVNQVRRILYGLKCPVCSKFILPDDIECHLVMCLTKPRLSYNEDILSDEKGECVICLEELQPGDVIARLPCLCIYHKNCIDRWFQVNRSCPEHPGD
ncbi:E3 ubiquitin-protein ligase ZNRF2 isoform X4 [Megachile rotundata]|uniref:E3 ubiquitin-protein ligase ZNRF2 isoform X4 n=1 Tax=Megachile rotundata TaxID=143995 RepID=UPI003FD6AEF3